jgi:hypothetical protein
MDVTRRHIFQREPSLDYTVRSSQVPFDTRAQTAHRVGLHLKTSYTKIYLVISKMVEMHT